ncbi:hypothetical protein [Mycolicibacterium septicum]|nr:hypothetical protein [Mycolicibacterium septicum]
MIRTAGIVDAGLADQPATAGLPIGHDDAAIQLTARGLAPGLGMA